MMALYQMGTPSGGGFSSVREFETDAEARRWARSQGERVLDIQEVMGEHNEPILMLVCPDE
jgi:hypothetical protein